MKPSDYISFLNKIEKLKCTMRHSWTSCGRQESVAEHSWRLACMALLCADEYPDIDINKVIKMCLIHDFGEAITGDIPAFDKTLSDETKEQKAVLDILHQLPLDISIELEELFAEMDSMQSLEAKLFKALDNMEALISHNEADLCTWIDREYQENLIYGQNNVEWSNWTLNLKNEINRQSIEKIKNESNIS